MPKVSPIQNDFSGGEFSPLAQGRVDAKEYRNGVALLDNYLCTYQGPVTRRPGTELVHVTRAEAGNSRLIPFVVTPERAYMMEASSVLFRFFLNGDLVLNTGFAITNIELVGTDVRITAPGHDFASSPQRFVITGVVGMEELNGREFTASSGSGDFSGDTVFLRELTGGRVVGTGYGTYTSGGTASKPYEVAVPYASSALPDLRFLQDKNVMYIAHPDYAPAKITISAAGTATFSYLTFTDGPYLPTNATTTTLTPNAFALGASATVTASSTTGINDNQGFLSTDVGRFIRMEEGTTWGYAQITAFIDSLNVTATILASLTDTTSKTSWRMGLYSDTTGYPACMEFHEDRLYFAGCPVTPQRIDGSRSLGDYGNFSPSLTTGTVESTHAVNATMNSADENTIRWMRSDEKGLLLGTSASPWLVTSAGTGDAIGPTSIVARRLASEGSANVEAVRAGKSTLYVDVTQRKINEVRYFYDVDGFDPISVSDVAEHLLTTGAEALCYQKDTIPTVWMANGEGKLIGATYKRRGESLSIGWHRHTFTDATILDAATITIQDADGIPRNELWLVVDRSADNAIADRAFIERMTPVFDDSIDQNDAFFVDGGVSYSGASATTVKGLFHFEGETVDIYADGALRTPAVVSAGKVTFSPAATNVLVGKNIVARGKMLRIEAGAADGTALGKTRRTHRVGFLLHRTLGLKYGPSFDELSEIDFREASDDMDEAVPLFSGIKSVELPSDYDFENQICWQQDTPLPGTILAIMPQMHTQDR